MSRLDLVDFVLVGPFKTGTSWMDVLLRSHPGVVLPSEVKETFYFNDDSIHARGEDWFKALFATAEPLLKRGEVGPSYFHSESALPRIRAAAPDCRIICSLRDPAARLYSFYLHLLQRGEVRAGEAFLDVLDQRPFLLETARYGHHTKRWQQAFGRERVTVLQYEDLLHDKQGLVDSLCAGIGIDSIKVVDEMSGRVNESLMPSNQRVTRVAYSVARYLRRHGFHQLTNTAKNSGVRRLLFSSYSEKPRLSSDEQAVVHARLRDDLDLLSECVERRFDWQQPE